MQTHFSLAQLADPKIQRADEILRKCVHCGFCTATCPTYVLLGDELDGPRGRIYLIKDMLENERPASEEVVRHVDRCLSCLACMTTCPSGVNYMHLVDHARVHIEETYERPLVDRALRAALATVLPRPFLFRLAVAAGWLARPFGRLMPARLRPMLDLVPSRLGPLAPRPRRRLNKAWGARRGRVALLTGCVQDVLGGATHDATLRLLQRHGVDVVIPHEGCCGSLAHHMGKSEPALAAARASIDAWSAEIEGEGLDAIIVNASGCGTTLKDYGHMFADDPAYAAKAARVAALAKDITEYVDDLGLMAPVRETGQAVAYHSACSLQHGQRVTAAPVALLSAAGFDVRSVPEGHLCCGSAGTYNMLQPALSAQLRARKAANIRAVRPDIVATGNLGCAVQIGDAAGVPVVHTVELLDWATGGPVPEALGL